MREVAEVLSSTIVLLGGTYLLVGAPACTSSLPARDGHCDADTDRALHCGEISEQAANATDDFASYSCTGNARPDDDPRYVEGVPQGIVCADDGARDDAGVQGYCCTTRATSCAYNPVADCDEPTYGYQCRGANRPESLNPALSCGNGVRQDDLINYCCSGTPQMPGCLQSDSVQCSSRLMGWTCLGDNLPRGEQLGANKSRSDFYHLLCPVPTPAANPAYNNYCCYAPAPVPAGGSCVQNNSVPGCQAGRFGFACYGPETPQDDYLPMHCDEPGFAGRSAEGYPATLYCCDFQ